MPGPGTLPCRGAAQPWGGYEADVTRHPRGGPPGGARHWPAAGAGRLKAPAVVHTLKPLGELTLPPLLAPGGTRALGLAHPVVAYK